MAGKKDLLGNILISKNLITKNQLERALGLQKINKDFLGAILIKEGYIKESDLLSALSEQFDIPLGAISDTQINWDVVGRFPKTLIVEHRCFPLYETEFHLILALSNPLDAGALSEAQKYAGEKKLKPMLVNSADMDRALEFYQNFTKNKIRRFFT